MPVSMVGYGRCIARKGRFALQQMFRGAGDISRAVALSPKSDRPYCRTLILYPGVSLQRPHAHRFIELILSLDGEPLTIDYGDGDVVDSPAHIVTPLRQHAIVRAGPVARLYVAVGMRSIQDLRSFARIVPGDHSTLRAKLQGIARLSVEDAGDITLAWQQEWLPTFETARDIDPRILRCIKRVNAKSDPRMAREELAAMVTLSPSRFAALFNQEIGIPLNRYIIWRRVLLALEYLKAGEGTTRAAVSAGFSDASHLCRCYRNTFGSPPNVLPVGAIIQHGDGLEFLVN